MNTKDKQASRYAGILIIIGIIAGIFSVVPSVESANFLVEIFPNKAQVWSGAFFQFLLAPIYIGFSLVLYPLLKRYNPGLSIGFVGFRFMAGTFQLIGMIILPLLIMVSQSYSTASPYEIPIYEWVGNALRTGRDLSNHLGVVLATGLGNLLFYVILYRGKFLPNWLTIWGFIGNILIMLAGFLVLFQLIEVVSPEYLMISSPIVLQEIVLAIWLIAKGFHTIII